MTALKQQEAEESAELAPNSYGAGYDDGYASALDDILKSIDEWGWASAVPPHDEGHTT